MPGRGGPLGFGFLKNRGGASGGSSRYGYSGGTSGFSVDDLLTHKLTPDNFEVLLRVFGGPMVAETIIENLINDGLAEEAIAMAMEHPDRPLDEVVLDTLVEQAKHNIRAEAKPHIQAIMQSIIDHRMPESGPLMGLDRSIHDTGYRVLSRMWGG